MQTRSPGFFSIAAFIAAMAGMPLACSDSEQGANDEGVGGFPAVVMGTGGMGYDPDPGTSRGNRGNQPSRGAGGDTLSEDGFAACVPQFCPPSNAGAPCCVSANGPCGVDTGNGCSTTGETGRPPGGGRGGRGGGRGGFPGFGGQPDFGMGGQGDDGDGGERPDDDAGPEAGGSPGEPEGGTPPDAGNDDAAAETGVGD